MRKICSVVLAFVAPLALLTGASSGAQGVSRWAPESTAKITPGVQMYTDGAQCTANFVYTDRRGRVYVGYAAHCAGLGSSSDTNGCTTRSLPLGTSVTFRRGGTLVSDGEVVGHGRLAYSSWLTMQRIGTKRANRCAFNDFALVRVLRVDRGKVNPTVPGFGGPTGLRSSLMAPGAPVYSVGASSLSGPFDGAKSGNVIEAVGRGWAYDVETGNPGVPGDSGSGYLDRFGHAVGVLSTLSAALGITPVTNTIGNLYKEMAFARRHSGIGGLHLVKGTRGFSTG